MSDVTFAQAVLDADSVNMGGVSAQVVQDAAAEVSARATEPSTYGRPVLMVRGRDFFSKTVDSADAVEWFMNQVDNVMTAVPDAELCFWLPAGAGGGFQAPRQLLHLDPTRVGTCLALIAQRYPHATCSVLCGFFLDEDPTTLFHDFMGGSFDDVAYREAVIDQYRGLGILFRKMYLDAFVWAPATEREPWRTALMNKLGMEVVGEGVALDAEPVGPAFSEYRKLRRPVATVGADLSGRYVLASSYVEQETFTRAILTMGGTPMISHGPGAARAVTEAALARRFGVDPSTTLASLASQYRRRVGQDTDRPVGG
jgi:hypothetical protein